MSEKEHVWDFEHDETGWKAILQGLTLTERFPSREKAMEKAFEIIDLYDEYDSEAIQVVDFLRDYALEGRPGQLALAIKHTLDAIDKSMEATAVLHGMIEHNEPSSDEDDLLSSLLRL